MNTRLLFGLLWLTPTLCFGALSTTTSYFLNIEALTNVTARSTVRADSGVFTNGLYGGTITSPLLEIGELSISNLVTGFVFYDGNVVTNGPGVASSANLLSILSDETGTGASVFGTSPTIATPTIDVVLATKAFRRHWGTLTHAGTTTLDFNGAQTANLLAATGSVTVAFSNLATNLTYTLRIVNTQSTNIDLTFPAGSLTNFYGGKPVTLAPGKRGRLVLEAFGTTDADVDAAWTATMP